MGIKKRQPEASDDLAQNLRTLCSFAKSTSEVCRRVGINRQQFSKYLNGHARPSLSTLRRLCNFFGVDEYEIFLDEKKFQEIVSIRSEDFSKKLGTIGNPIEYLFNSSDAQNDIINRHKGYYHVYQAVLRPPSALLMRSLMRISIIKGSWCSKSIDRNFEHVFQQPRIVKYKGSVIESSGHLVVIERGQGPDQDLFVTMVYTSTYESPTFLSGLILYVDPGGAHEIGCRPVIWDYLGQTPDLRAALGASGMIENPFHSNEEKIRTFAAKLIPMGSALHPPL